MGKKKCLIILLIIVVAFSALSLPASAAPTVEEYNKQVKDRCSELELKYYIKISYPVRPDGYIAIGISSLNALDTSLSYLSQEFVQELSLYYRSTYGQRLHFEFAYMPAAYQLQDISALGFFSSEKSLIQLFIPTPGQNMTVTGSGPFTVLHEMGHAYYLFASEKIGSKQMKSDWNRLNGSDQYKGTIGTNPNRETFASAYAAFNYEEDFAESFAYAFCCNRAGLGISHRFQRKDGTVTGLGKKVRYLETSVLQHVRRNKGALTGIGQMRSAASSIEYNGIKLTGNSLEYIGFSQPSGILPNILNQLKIEATVTEWDWQVGGWVVSDIAGGTYLVFPGCGYVTLRFPTKRVNP